MTTMRQLIVGSLRLINVVQANESPTADDMNVSLYAFNTLLDSWSAERLGIFTINPYFFQVHANKQNYTLGAGGDWDVVRPMQIQQATLTFNAGTPVSARELNYSATMMDYPLELLNDAQYAGIATKGITSPYPTKLYDNGDYPLRTITVWPIPSSTQTITLWLWQPLVTKDTLDVDVNLPKGYERALRFGLAVELAAEFGKDLTESIVRVATDAKAVLKRLNAGPQVMVNDIALSRASVSVYNNLLAVSTGS